MQTKRQTQKNFIITKMRYKKKNKLNKNSIPLINNTRSKLLA